MPRKPTRKAAAMAEDLRQAMTRLKEDMEELLPRVVDWQESKGAMLGAGHHSPRDGARRHAPT
jgi:hypothetical protein